MGETCGTCGRKLYLAATQPDGTCFKLESAEADGECCRLGYERERAAREAAEARAGELQSMYLESSAACAAVVAQLAESANGALGGGK